MCFVKTLFIFEMGDGTIILPPKMKVTFKMIFERFRTISIMLNPMALWSHGMAAIPKMI